MSQGWGTNKEVTPVLVPAAKRQTLTPGIEAASKIYVGGSVESGDCSTVDCQRLEKTQIPGPIDRTYHSDSAARLAFVRVQPGLPLSRYRVSGQFVDSMCHPNIIVVWSRKRADVIIEVVP